MLAPVSRWSNETPFITGFSGGKFCRTCIECLPVWETRANIAHVLWVPPLLTRNCIVRPQIDGTFRDGLFETVALRTLPDLDLEIHIAVSKSGILQLSIGRDIFDVVTLFLEKFSDNGRQNQLTRPIILYNLDGIGGFGRLRHSRTPSERR